jgi:hypothetical protein
MQSVVSSIASGTVQIWEAALLMAAAAVRVPPPRKTRRDVQVDSRTLTDIGVEPGSITWM